MTFSGTAKAILERKHWVFDLDGTLTLPVHDFTLIRNALGVPKGTDILRHLASLDDSQGQPLQDKLKEIETGLLDRVEPAPGSIELIETLSRRGSRMAVQTRNTRDIALKTLDNLGIGGYFEKECILGRDDAAPKPDPEGLFRLCIRWETNPGEVVMVGDYLFDLQTGRNAGAGTVHVDHTRSYPWPEFTDIGVGSLKELLDILPA